ncbi:MAG: tetratricopeptide repeat protein [Candidatus Obscuribacterales bacterium]|nr:tetratricopeptide repeat protein [Candidatus Obscuribacterales bacterium]
MHVRKLNNLLPLLMAAAAVIPAANATEVISPAVHQGYTLITQRSYVQAIAVLNRAVRLNPSDAAARRYLAVALNQTGNSIKAAQQMELVIRLEPGIASDCALIGDMYLLCGETARAVTRYKEGILLSPESAHCRCGLAAAYAAAGDCANARATCIDGLKICRDAAARKRLAQILGDTGPARQTVAPDARG